MEQISTYLHACALEKFGFLQERVEATNTLIWINQMTCGVCD